MRKIGFLVVAVVGLACGNDQSLWVEASDETSSWTGWNTGGDGSGGTVELGGAGFGGDPWVTTSSGHAGGAVSSNSNAGGGGQASGGQGGYGVGGGCNGAKVCEGLCFAWDDPAYGCASLDCVPCQLKHVKSATCVDGACAPGECHEGWGDCNGDPADGCEALFAYNPDHCGGCGHSCGEEQVCDDHVCYLPCGAVLVPLTGGYPICYEIPGGKHQSETLLTLGGKLDQPGLPDISTEVFEGCQANTTAENIGGCELKVEPGTTGFFHPRLIGEKSYSLCGLYDWQDGQSAPYCYVVLEVRNPDGSLRDVFNGEVGGPWSYAYLDPYGKPVLKGQGKVVLKYGFF